MRPTVIRWLAQTLALATLVLLPTTALAAGKFTIKSTSVQEVSGGWHIFVTVELPKPPAIAHQSMRFVFEKTAVYERSLVDGHSDPVPSRAVVRDDTPATESLDVDFSDGRGKIFKGTRFDFSLTRTRGYVAGEYKVTLRTADGTSIGGSQSLTLKGDNEVVDRRSITFEAKKNKIQKVDDGVDGGAPGAQSDAGSGPAAGGMGEVEATGSAEPFIPADAYNKTPEEDIKVKKSGCGCSVPGTSAPLPFGALVGPALMLGLARLRRRR